MGKDQGYSPLPPDQIRLDADGEELRLLQCGRAAACPPNATFEIPVLSIVACGELFKPNYGLSG